MPQSAIIQRTFTVSDPQMAWTGPATMPPATRGVAYSLNLAAAANFPPTGGTPPYVYSMVDAAGNTTAPPPGMTLTPAGLFSGTPTTTSSFSVNFKATDSAP